MRPFQPTSVEQVCERYRNELELLDATLEAASRFCEKLEGIGLGGLQTDLQNDEMVFSMPININNTGYYDMTEFTIASEFKDYKGAVITANTTKIPQIKSGSTGSTTHSLSRNLPQMLSNMTSYRSAVS